MDPWQRILEDQTDHAAVSGIVVNQENMHRIVRHGAIGRQRGICLSFVKLQ
jgi:hypothetical protein